MTPLIKSIIKYTTMILVGLTMGYLINGSCNKPKDLSDYERQEFERQIDVFQKNNLTLQAKLDSLKADNERIDLWHIERWHTVMKLIGENRNLEAIRMGLESEIDSLKKYSNEPLTSAELDSVAVKLAECAGLRKLYNNVLAQNEVLDFKARGLENIIELKDLTIKSLENKVEAIDPAWYDTFNIGVITTLIAEGLIIIAVILLQ